MAESKGKSTKTKEAKPKVVKAAKPQQKPSDDLSTSIDHAFQNACTNAAINGRGSFGAEHEGVGYQVTVERA